MNTFISVVVGQKQHSSSKNQTARYFIHGNLVDPFGPENMSLQEAPFMSYFVVINFKQF